MVTILIVINYQTGRSKTQFDFRALVVDSKTLARLNNTNRLLAMPCSSVGRAAVCNSESPVEGSVGSSPTMAAQTKYDISKIIIITKTNKINNMKKNHHFNLDQIRADEARHVTDYQTYSMNSTKFDQVIDLMV